MSRLAAILCLLGASLVSCSAPWKHAGLTVLDTLNVPWKDSDISVSSGLQPRASSCLLAPINSYAHQVSINVAPHFLCGGSIISTLWVLTSAWCALSTSLPNIKVRSGSINWNSGGTVTNVSLRIIHPEFSYSYLGSNVALLKVTTAFVLSTTVKKIALPTQNQTIPADLTAAVTGWGSWCGTSQWPNMTAELLVNSMQTWSPSSCQTFWTNNGNNMPPNFENSFCAMPPALSSGCQGDKGGPMVYNNQLIGVNSHSYCFDTYPTVFTQVSMVRSWITTNAGV